MDPYVAHDNHSLYDFMQRITFQKQWFGYWTLHFEGRQETFHLPGKTEDTEVCNWLRMILDILHPYSTAEQYEAWRQEYLEFYGEQEPKKYYSVRTYKNMLDVQKQLYRLFAESYPLFAYSENDL